MQFPISHLYIEGNPGGTTINQEDVIIWQRRRSKRLRKPLSYLILMAQVLYIHFIIKINLWSNSFLFLFINVITLMICRYYWCQGAECCYEVLLLFIVLKCLSYCLAVLFFWCPPYLGRALGFEMTEEVLSLYQYFLWFNWILQWMGFDDCLQEFQIFVTRKGAICLFTCPW